MWSDYQMSGFQAFYYTHIVVSVVQYWHKESESIFLEHIYSTVYTWQLQFKKITRIALINIQIEMAEN